MTTYEARNRFGDVVRTFSCKPLAEAYRDRMAVVGSVITIQRVVVSRRAAA